ncbi:hypothetical protein POVWA2_046140 [Plasmodium ovale wallikeri]|uniref:Uncharacterized protein n=1 Tax=Plasmodium ovale wallikeri TaxID=864142 RepID=A0A1A8ZI83_PLAOA|nr:hypothetical protein POVWA1_047230 [Plasmodium ovale wallikeri]SBT43544.1 hypothetical protein POVWA2_046140 [Plasmodium ovale wallikeri]
MENARQTKRQLENCHMCHIGMEKIFAHDNSNMIGRGLSATQEEYEDMAGVTMEGMTMEGVTTAGATIVEEITKSVKHKQQLIQYIYRQQKLKTKKRKGKQKAKRRGKKNSVSMVHIADM